MDLLTSLTSRSAVWLLALVPAVVAGCATTGPYQFNDTTLSVVPVRSTYHNISYVRSYVEDGEFVLYGKVEHNHGDCPNGEHVDLAVNDATDQVLITESLALKRTTSAKQHGWYGASFRTRLTPVPSAGARVTLVVHDSNCLPADGAFDCGENAAASVSSVAAPPRGG